MKRFMTLILLAVFASVPVFAARVNPHAKRHHHRGHVVSRIGKSGYKGGKAVGKAAYKTGKAGAKVTYRAGRKVVHGTKKVL